MTMLAPLAALPAMAEVRTCTIGFDAGDHRLSISRTGDGAGPSSESAYLLVLLDRDPAASSWPIAHLEPGAAPGSGTLVFSLTFAPDRSRRYRWRISGARGDYDAPGTGLTLRLDWATLDARFAGEDRVKVSAAIDAPGAAPVSAGTVSLADIRLALAARPAISAVAERVLADPASDCADGASDTHYDVDCGEAWEDGEGRYSTWGAQLEWQRSLGDHARLRLVYYQVPRDFDVRGFPPAGSPLGPLMVIFFDDGLGEGGPARANYPKNGPSRQVVFAELGSGERKARTLLGYGSYATFDWRDVSRARGGEGELLIELVHVEHGPQIRIFMPGSAFPHIERQLREGWARRRARQHHPEQCGLSDIETVSTARPVIPATALPRRKRGP